MLLVTMHAPAPAQGQDFPASPPAPAAASTASAPRVLVISAHPDLRSSRVNRRLTEAVRSAARRQPGIELRELYLRYPDFAIDVGAEQAALALADLIVWQHPIHWYAMPALMKHWVDEVLTHGWAYGHAGTALAGKALWLVASTGAPEAAYHPRGYNRYFFDAFLPPYEQTAALCGLRFLPPLLVHGAHRIALAELSDLACTYEKRLAGWPDTAVWPELDELANCDACLVPEQDRPTAEPPAARLGRALEAVASAMQIRLAPAGQGADHDHPER
ncbi:MAG: hypothetical protein RL722_933 [Pseudomonadota bacterium]|jgi:glutathione-regulated potassium-efflux system ancillary protein KefF